MELQELVIEMKLLERRLTLYEEKYGVLSEDFFAALTVGKLVRYDEYDETRSDFSRWKGIYETWLRRNVTLASTFPHHKHVAPDIRSHRIPALGMSFARPNLAVIIQEIEGLLKQQLS